MTKVFFRVNKPRFISIYGELSADIPIYDGISFYIVIYACEGLTARPSTISCSEDTKKFKARTDCVNICILINYASTTLNTI